MRKTTVEALVVDASVATKWALTDEEYATEALGLLVRFQQGQLDLLAPEHIRYEVHSAITNATRGKEPRLHPEVARELIREFLQVGITLHGDDELIVAASEVVHRTGIAYYDALYVALAERLDLALVTADDKLFGRIGHLPPVKWIGDYAAPSTVGGSTLPLA